MHTFLLTTQVEHGDGSFINKADISVFPVSTDMSGALVRIAPGEGRESSKEVGCLTCNHPRF